MLDTEYFYEKLIRAAVEEQGAIVGEPKERTQRLVERAMRYNKNAWQDFCERSEAHAHDLYIDHLIDVDREDW